MEKNEVWRNLVEFNFEKMIFFESKMAGQTLQKWYIGARGTIFNKLLSFVLKKG